MMKVVLISLLLASAAGPFRQGMAEWPDPREIEGRPHINQELLQVLHLYQSDHSCTAFIIGRNLVATAAHCIDPKGDIILQSMYGMRVYAKPLYVGTVGGKDDVAILSAPTGKIIPLRVAKTDPKLPTWCAFVGFASTGHQSILPCIVGQGGQFGWDIMGQARSGDSGGPLFGSNGEIIGVVTRSDGSNHGAVTDLSHLNDAIRKANEKLAQSRSCGFFGLFCTH